MSIFPLLVEGAADDGLRRLGKILHLSKGRSLVLKLESDLPPRVGVKIVDSKLTFVGTVHDVFGPVASPYAAVKPSSSNPAGYVGKIVYSSTEE